MAPTYYIGLDVHKQKISYCVKDVRCSSLESEQRELPNVWNPCDDLTRRKSSKIVNQGPPF